MALLTTFGSPIDAERFLKAVDAVVQTSDALRTTVREIDGVPHPGVSTVPPSPTTVLRLDREDLDEWMQTRISRPIDLGKAAYESVLIDHGNDEWSWWVNVHHIVIDAASSANFFNAVADHYHGENYELPGYADVWAELSEKHNAARVDKARDHWAMTEGDAAPTSMYRPDSGPTSLADRVMIDMSSGRQQALDALLEDRFRLLSPDLSLTVALATALSCYLAKLGNDEVTIGIPIHHRSTKNAKRVIGPLVELFPLRVDMLDDDTYVSLHERIGKSLFELLQCASPGSRTRHRAHGF